MAKQLFTITYSLTTQIEAENFQDAREKFYGSKLETLNENADLDELISVEDEQNRMEHEME